MARFQVLAETSVNVTALRDVARCSVVEIDRRFRGAYCLHHQSDVTKLHFWFYFPHFQNCDVKMTRKESYNE
jgi:hypothetical protein